MVSKTMRHIDARSGLILVRLAVVPLRVVFLRAVRLWNDARFTCMQRGNREGHDRHSRGVRRRRMAGAAGLNSVSYIASHALAVQLSYVLVPSILETTLPTIVKSRTMTIPRFS